MPHASGWLVTLHQPHRVVFDSLRNMMGGRGIVVCVHAMCKIMHSCDLE